MKSWQQIVQSKLTKQKNKIATIHLENETVVYSEKIKSNRALTKLTGDEEVVRAFLIDRLVNELDYNPEILETEKEYTIKGGHGKIRPRIDLLVKDNRGNHFFFIEIKAPGKYEADKSEIEGQLFSLAQTEEREHKTKVKYLVYYTAEMRENCLGDRAIIIDFEKYKTHADWAKDGYVSIGTELTPGYGEPKKPPYMKGDKTHDLRTQINRDEIESLARNLHNVLWGGGGTNDSEIFYSLVNIILAKIQDESEKEVGQEYDFQVYQYGNNVEAQHTLYARINALYKRALKDKMNVSEQHKIDDDNIINTNKFPLNKLLYTVQALESFSFLEGRSSLGGKDILGDFFETITRDGFKQNKGQFFTPTPVVNFLLYGLQLDQLAIERLNNVRELPLIMDPSAGSGTFLIEAMKLITRELKYRLRDKVKPNHQTKQRFDELFMPDHAENKWAREYLYGSEINFDLGTASKVNMILHGDGSSNIFVKDGLLPFRNYVKETSPNYLETAVTEPLYKDKEVNGKFDVVISNPPFSVELDTQTQRGVINTFLFGDKKNSENLFIERYYQLLKTGGRLGVVLPESVFDTTENKYIRLFLFKYFHIKAVVSLPQITFEPFTSTKTSLLFAQKKTNAEVTRWDALWNQYGNEWSRLVTRMTSYREFFVEGKSINKKWAKDVVSDLSNNIPDNILKNIQRFLKDYLTSEDKQLKVKELLLKYQDEIEALSKHEKETDAFGFYNAWWVFGEVAKDTQVDCEIFMAEAENVGYKRTKRGENPMPNDLYDLEYAPCHLDCEAVNEHFMALLGELEKQKIEKEQDIASAQKKKVSETIEKRLEKLNADLQAINELVAKQASDNAVIEEMLACYYGDNTLKDEYLERTDSELICHFKNGLLSRYKSDNIVLRKTSQYTLLDAIRQEVTWA